MIPENKIKKIKRYILIEIFNLVKRDNYPVMFVKFCLL